MLMQDFMHNAEGKIKTGFDLNIVLINTNSLLKEIFVIIFHISK